MTESFETNLKNIPTPAPRGDLAADIINTAKATPQAFTWPKFWQGFARDLRRPQWLVTAATLLLFGVLLGYQLHEVTGSTSAVSATVEANNSIATVDDVLPADIYSEEIYTLEAFDEAIWG